MPGLTYRRFRPGQAPEVLTPSTRAMATQRGQTVVVTCMGGLGRSGTLAACLLVSAGEASQRRPSLPSGPHALGTIAQEDFVVIFAAAISGARWLSPPWRARANRAKPP